METLVTDKENPHLLIVGSYRDNEVENIHPLKIRLRNIEQTNVVDIISIQLGNLDEDVVNAFISDTLNMDYVETEPLAATVHSKTHGNIFFVRAFLKAMADDELLAFNFGTLKWSWKIEDINTMYVTSNVLDLLLIKLRRIPVEESQVLSISSCLGSCFDLPILVVIVGYLRETMADNAKLSFIRLTVDNVIPSVEKDLSEGLLEHASTDQKDLLRFSHDQIQQAAFSLIPKESKELLQWSIGQALVRKLTPDQLSEVLFGAVDLLNSGLDEFTSTHANNNSKELFRLAELNMAAGERALAISAFQQAATYLQKSIKCISSVTGSEDLSWIRHPEFCLKAYQMYAGSLYCNNDFETMKKTLDIIFKYAASKEGRVTAYSTLVEAYCARDQFREAFDTAFTALNEFGVSFPRKPGQATVIFELIKTKRFMKKYPIKRLHDLPRMNDPSLEILLKMLVRLTPHAYLESVYLPLITFLLVKFSCLHGVCSSTPPAFAIYGLILAGALGDLKGGYDYAMCAMDLLEQIEDRTDFSFTCLVVSTSFYNESIKPTSIHDKPPCWHPSRCLWSKQTRDQSC